MLDEICFTLFVVLAAAPLLATRRAEAAEPSARYLSPAISAET